jgi:hypothetical protein
VIYKVIADRKKSEGLKTIKPIKPTPYEYILDTNNIIAIFEQYPKQIIIRGNVKDTKFKYEIEYEQLLKPFDTNKRIDVKIRQPYASDEYYYIKPDKIDYLFNTKKIYNVKYLAPLKGVKINTVEEIIATISGQNKEFKVYARYANKNLKMSILDFKPDTVSVAKSHYAIFFNYKKKKKRILW